MEKLDKTKNSIFIPWEQRHKLLLRIIASIVVVAFIFTQTGLGLAYDRDDIRNSKDKINPRQVTKDHAGYLGLEAFKEKRKLEINEVEQRRKAEQQRTVTAVAQYNLDKAMYASDEKRNVYGIYAERLMDQQSIVQEIIRIQSLFGKDHITYDDGMIVNFDPFSGLTTSVLHERVDDGHGNVSLRDTFNMRYNDRRLLISYKSTTTAPNGLITHLYRNDINYMPGSVF